MPTREGEDNPLFQDLHISVKELREIFVFSVEAYKTRLRMEALPSQEDKGLRIFPSVIFAVIIKEFFEEFFRDRLFRNNVVIQPEDLALLRPKDFILSKHLSAKLPDVVVIVVSFFAILSHHAVSLWNGHQVFKEPDDAWNQEERSVFDIRMLEVRFLFFVVGNYLTTVSYTHLTLPTKRIV